MKNIVLIGMPGTGKSFVGAVLAKKLGFSFVDGDELIMEKSGRKLATILWEDGLEAFFRIEEQVGLEMDFEDTVIATGGSMVLYPDAMEHLKTNGIAVWLRTPIEVIEGRKMGHPFDHNIAADPGSTIRQIYEHRRPLYEKYADLSVESVEGPEAVADAVISALRTRGMEI